MLQNISTAASLVFLSLLLPLNLVADDKESNQPTTNEISIGDESLLLLRILENLYSEWPSESTADEFVRSAANIRETAIKFKEHIEDTPALEQDIAKRYGELVEALDKNIYILQNVGLIKAEALKKFKKNSFSAGVKGGATGVTAFHGLMSSGDIQTIDAAAAAVVVGGLVSLWDFWGKNSRASEVEKNAVKAEVQKLKDYKQSSLYRAQTTARSLAKRYGWKPGQYGWELQGQFHKKINQLLKEENYRGAGNEFARELEIRPNDPLLIIFGIWMCTDMMESSGFVFTRQEEEQNVQALLGHSLMAVYALGMFPSSGVYDEYRNQAILTSYRAARVGRLRELRAGISPGGQTKASQLAAMFSKLLLDNNPRDPTGIYRVLHAYALSENLQNNEALEYANQVLDKYAKDWYFCFKYSCILSRANINENTGAWLRQAIHHGYEDIQWIKNSPCLQNYRNSKPKDYAELITPKWTWGVTDDWFWDDIWMKNDSHFPLNNVVLKVTLMKGNHPKKLTLKCPRLAPGEKKTWKNIVKTVSGRWDNTSTADFTSVETE